MSWLGPSMTPTTPIAATSSTPPTRLSLLSHTAGIYQFPASERIFLDNLDHLPFLNSCYALG
jgi:hypothetical protein